MRKAFAILVGAGLTLLFAEVVLRSIREDRYHVWKPGVSTLSHVVPGVMPGIEGPARFTIGAHGLRGDPFDSAQRHRVLALGGSTTECFYLDEEETWTHLLQENLRRATGERVWVGSAGRSGHHARQHALQARFLLGQYPRIDTLLVLVGVNDFHQFLAHDGRWRSIPPFDRLHPQRRLQDLRSAFAVIPSRYAPREAFPRNTELWQRLRRVRRGLGSALQAGPNVLDSAGEIYERWRSHRRENTGLRRKLPHLGLVLRDYRRNLKHTIEAAREHGVRPVLMTQPTMWRKDLPPELRELLLFGGVGDYFSEPGKEYYSVGALAAGMDAFNRNLKSVCEEMEVDCIDLASALPKDDTVFFDDCHFNESGARAVAEVVAQYFVDHLELPGGPAPFGTPRGGEGDGGPIAGVAADSRRRL